MDLKPVKGLRPFTKFLMTIGELPSSYLVSMTYEEQLLWLCNYLQNVVIPTVNNNGEAVEELQNLFIELKDYVDNYFENLDIQTEIDNKLDEMAESGELAEIIAEYIDMNAVFVYDTIADLAAAENLKDGSSAYCLGKDTYDDGKGAFYKIREITISDVVDGYLIVAITNTEDLIGERLPNYEINQINSTLETLTETTIPGIQNDIDTINTTTIPGVQSTVEGELNTFITNDYNVFKSHYKNNDYLIVLGDSYGTGYGDVTPFTTFLQTNLGLDNDHYITSSVSGIGFCNVAYSQVFLDVLSGITANLTTEQKNKITKIVIQAGINDRSYTTENIYNAIVAVNNHIKANYPNAKFYICACGRSSDPNRNTAIITNVLPAFRKAQGIGVINILNSEYILHDYTLFQADGWHPTEDGQKVIAECLAQGLMTGACNVAYKQEDSVQNLITPAGKLTAVQDVQLRTTTTNGVSTIILDNRCSFTCVTADRPTLNGGSFKIGEIPNHGIGKRTANILLTFGMIPVHGYVHGTRGGVTADYELDGYLSAYENNGVYELYFRSSFYYYPSANQITDVSSGFITAFTFTLDSLRC